MVYTRIIFAAFILVNSPRQLLCECTSTSYKFGQTEGRKMIQNYEEIAGTSAIGCTAVCGNDFKCLSASFHNEDGVCLLSKYRLDDVSRVTNDSGWTSYIKLSDQCPEGWILYHRSCYLFGNQLCNWERAEEQCQKLGGHLVTIDCQAENEFVSYHAANVGTCWIGLNDRAKDGTFVWASDQSKAVFTLWASSQPDGNSAEDCVTVKHNPYGLWTWYDRDCGTLNFYICEM